MDIALFVLTLLAAAGVLRAREQHRRIALLASHLGRYRIERQLEQLTQGYLRALGQEDPQRRAQAWDMLRAGEEQLCEQFTRFAADFARAEAAATRVSRVPFWLPLAPVLAPTFDMRRAIAVHARGICRAIQQPAAASPRDRAYTITAELFLMQHTCHWFCRSRLVASARMLSRHKTSYGQLLESVTPQTRAEYLELVRQG